MKAAFASLAVMALLVGISVTFRINRKKKKAPQGSATSEYFKPRSENITPQNVWAQGINETPTTFPSTRNATQAPTFSVQASLAEASHRSVAKNRVESEQGRLSLPSNPGEQIDLFFKAAVNRFGSALQESSPIMVKKILQDYKLLPGNILTEEICADLLEPKSFDALKSRLRAALIKNEAAFAPVISMMDVAVKERWFDRKFQREGTVGCASCWHKVTTRPEQNPIVDLSKCVGDRVLKDGEDLAQCYAAEFANGLEVMQKLNDALLDNSFAENVRRHYAEVLAKKFRDLGMTNMTAELWQSMPALRLYRNVQETLYRTKQDDYPASQFKAMKIVSVMMPFETFHFMRQQPHWEKYGELKIAPRWRPTYEEFLLTHRGKSNWKFMQVNIQEASLGDRLAGLGNDHAANALMEYLEQHGTDVKMDWSAERDIATANFPPEWVGLYTLWNHLFVMSQAGRPMATAVLYFPFMLEDVDTWLHFRTYSLWMAIHEAVLTKSVQNYILPQDILVRIAGITKDYAETMKEKYNIKGEYKQKNKLAIPNELVECMSFFFRTFDSEDPDADPKGMLKRQAAKLFEQWRKRGPTMESSPISSLLALGANISINISTFEGMMTTCGEFFI